LLTTTTDATGVYSFTNLVPGVYQLAFNAPSGYAITYRDITNVEVTGATDANDSDIDPATGRTITTTLVSGEDDDTWDAGLYRPASLGDLVWEDTDGDGLQSVPPASARPSASRSPGPGATRPSAAATIPLRSPLPSTAPTPSPTCIPGSTPSPSSGPPATPSPPPMPVPTTATTATCPAQP
jgi:hypothetical protein